MTDEAPRCVATPTLDKRALIIEESHRIGDFLDWLSEQKIHLARYIKVEGYRDEMLVAISDGPSDLLHRYFDIDPAAEEAELRAVLEAHRAATR